MSDPSKTAVVTTKPWQWPRQPGTWALHWLHDSWAMMCSIINFCELHFLCEEKNVEKCVKTTEINLCLPKQNWKHLSSYQYRNTFKKLKFKSL